MQRLLRKQHQSELQQKEQQVFNLDSEVEETETKHGYDEEVLKSSCPVLNDVPAESFELTVDVLNDVAFTQDQIHTMEQAKTTLEQKWQEENGNKKIPPGKQINFTDPDSSIMLTKHHGVQQCYNHLAWVDVKAHIILGAHTSNNASDQLGLQPTLEHAEKMCGSLKDIQAGADAGFFSANNIAFMRRKGTDFYASYAVAKSPYAKDKFAYDAQSDTYTCPEGQMLSRQKTKKSGKIGEYSNKRSLPVLPASPHCTKGKRRYSENKKGIWKMTLSGKKRKRRLTVRKVKKILKQRKASRTCMGQHSSAG
ncbi:transposase [Lentibacillus sp. CBA3610]|uniref:transposase n=1 Tax=Lentibacillus sp. CBA3610 TaxID=2518176 RepID=UPI0015951F27|nr:transposase [Lentibacillus sp. CBA3610]QKY68739.1 hypothetical protein Len3610_03100 [Lentibacillus sp. CBA3610]